VELPDAVEKRLAELIEELRKVGTVTSTNGTQVTVTVQGASLTLPRLASYTPTIGDVVIIQGPAPYLVLGKPA
jgi:hypothetical protein